MASFNLIFLTWSTTLMLQWLILEGDARRAYHQRAEHYLGKHWKMRIEHIPRYLHRYGLVSNLQVTRRRCIKATEFVHMVRVHLHDIKYPYRWTSAPLEIPDILLWPFIMKAIFDDGLGTNDTGYKAFLKFQEAKPVYKYLLHGNWIFPAYIAIAHFSLMFIIPMVCRQPVIAARFIYSCLWNDKHRRFWRRICLAIELGERHFLRMALPYSVDHHVVQYQYLIPWLFRETTEEGEPPEVVDFQGPVTLWVEDDSDSQLDVPNLMNLLYNEDKTPKMELINMYHGVRVCLRTQPEYRNENWYELERARAAGAARRGVEFVPRDFPHVSPAQNYSDSPSSDNSLKASTSKRPSAFPRKSRRSTMKSGQLKRFYKPLNM